MTALDTGAHDRRREERLRDSAFRAPYDRAAREVGQIDRVIRALDALRIDQKMSKAELARRISRNESSIRRLFTSHQTRPEFPLLAAIAEVLGAQLAVVPVTSDARRSVKRRGGKRQLTAA